MIFLTSEDYWHNSNCINYAKFINIKHVQLKLLIFKNDLILVDILKISFIAKAIASIMNENISDTVNYFWLINDIKIELWEKFISVNLIVIQLVSDDEVFQIFVISKHDYRINHIMNLEISFFKCFNNDQ